MKNLLSKWRLTIPETVSCVVAVLAALVWLLSYFQNKAEASSDKQATENRINRLETDFSAIKTTVILIGNDVSYIRGRIDPHYEPKKRR